MTTSTLSFRWRSDPTSTSPDQWGKGVVDWRDGVRLDDVRSAVVKKFIDMKKNIDPTQADRYDPELWRLDGQTYHRDENRTGDVLLRASRAEAEADNWFPAGSFQPAPAIIVFTFPLERTSPAVLPAMSSSAARVAPVVINCTC